MKYLDSKSSTIYHQLTRDLRFHKVYLGVENIK